MRPDSRACEYSFLVEKKETAPNVSFTPTALKWIKAMVECHSGEIGFLGIVREIGDAYVITEIFYPKHCAASSSTCEISPEGEIEIAQQLIDSGRSDDIARVRVWGHSHHTMGTSPSGQDDSQALEKMNKCGAYFIRAICNKSGEMSVAFLDYQRQIKFENIKWTVEFDCEDILNKVSIAINSNQSSKDKIKAIQDVVGQNVDFEDAEYKNIEKQVRELKAKQLPEEKHSWGTNSSPNFGHHGYINSYDEMYEQPDMFGGKFSKFDNYDRFDNHSKPNRPNTYKQKQNPQPVPLPSHKELLTYPEISRIVDKIWPKEGAHAH